MRTSEERVDALHRRMDALKQKNDLRKQRILTAVTAAAGLLTAIFLALVVSNVPFQAPEAADQGAAASIFADHGALGYVVVALMAFLLGALVTILSFRLRKHRDQKQEEEQKTGPEEQNG